MHYCSTVWNLDAQNCHRTCTEISKVNWMRWFKLWVKYNIFNWHVVLFYYYYYYYYYKRMLLECRTVKTTSRTLNNNKIKSNCVMQFSQILNERLKSDVFSRRLKTDSDGDAVTSDCSKRELQRLWKHGHRRWHDALVECSARASKRNEVAVTSPCLPHGAVLVQCKQRKASTASLNSIRCGTRNQWRSWSSGVMWSHFRAEQTSRAAAFITDCSLSSWLLALYGRPM